MVFSRIDYFCNPAEPIADNSLSNDFSCRSFTGASNREGQLNCVTEVVSLINECRSLADTFISLD